ncbi:MAG: SPFH domain-containing protein [Hyphomicrobiales bacterium]
MIAFPWSLDDRPPPGAVKHKWWQFIEHHLPNLSLFLLIATLVAAVLYPQMVITVPSGQVGVLWKRFGGGTVLDPLQLRDEGLHIILPWDQLFLYDLRLQSDTQTYNAISKDGVSLSATMNMRFRLEHDYVPQLHQLIGPDYMRLLVRPEIGSRMREVISRFPADEVYSTARQQIQDEIRNSMEAKLGDKLLERMSVRGRSETSRRTAGSEYSVRLSQTIKVLDTLVLGIELPAAIVAAINRKTEQFYAIKEYEFRIDRERKESERKQIEAIGIRAFQQTVSQGISDSYLRWRGIDATVQLAQSSNTKVVIIGNTKDGLPIILGNLDTPQPTATATPTAESAATPKASTASPTTTTEKTPAASAATPTEKTPAATSSETTPAASSTTSSEKTPAASAATPSEKTPAATPSGKKAAASSSASSSTTKEESSSLWPPSLSAIKTIISRLLSPTASKTSP